MRTLSVGQLYDPRYSSYTPHARFDLIGSECSLDLFWDKLDAEDVARVSTAKASFALWYSGENDLFFLYRFGDDPWADTVFSIMQLPTEMRIRPPVSKANSDALAIHVSLTNAETGIVKARREFQLPLNFSRKLCNSVNRQFSRAYINNWSESAFLHRVRAVYAKYPEPEKLLQATGCISCRI